VRDLGKIKAVLFKLSSPAKEKIEGAKWIEYPDGIIQPLTLTQQYLNLATALFNASSSNFSNAKFEFKYQKDTNAVNVPSFSITTNLLNEDGTFNPIELPH
jgi:hypothetical protein